MSVAKKDRGQAKKPLPPNEDEGKLADENRFVRTNQALKWAKHGITDAKLYIYAKTGQIQESEDSAEVTEAFQKLDTYKEQITCMLSNAEKWTTSMLETWKYQSSFIESLKECNTVIQSFNPQTNEHELHEEKDEAEAADEDHKNDVDEHKSADHLHPAQPPQPAPSRHIINASNNSQFAWIVKGISDELYLNQQESERRYGHASKLLVVPLRNILDHEIMHALDMKRKYIACKRQFDNQCTTITHYKDKIYELEHPEAAKADSEHSQQGIGTLGKLRLGFGKLMQSNPTRDELQSKLEDARRTLPRYVKVFEQAKTQLLEAINVIEDKLNIEVVYYVQQFYQFVKEWKSGRASGGDLGVEHEQDERRLVGVDGHGHNEKNGNDVVEEEQVNDEKKKKEERAEVVLQAMDEQKNDEQANGKDGGLVAELQIDSMMNISADLDEVNLDSPKEVLERNGDVVSNENVVVVDVDAADNDVDKNESHNQEISNPRDHDEPQDEEEDDMNIEEIEISETHDVET